jgi:WD40 repeat protein
MSLEKSINAHGNVVSCINISPDGKILASSSQDLTLKLWSMELPFNLIKTLDIS